MDNNPQRDSCTSAGDEDYINSNSKNDENEHNSIAKEFTKLKTKNECVVNYEDFEFLSPNKNNVREVNEFHNCATVSETMLKADTGKYTLKQTAISIKRSCHSKPSLQHLRKTKLQDLNPVVLLKRLAFRESKCTQEYNYHQDSSEQMFQSIQIENSIQGSTAIRYVICYTHSFL